MKSRIADVVLFAEIIEGLSDAVFALGRDRELKPLNRRARELARNNPQPIGSPDDWLPAAHAAVESKEEVALEVEAPVRSQCAAIELRFRTLGDDQVVVVAREIAQRAHHDELRATFINRVAHDLRTPLTTAMLTVDLLASGASMDLESLECLAILREQLEREQSIVEELLVATRLESGALHLDPAPMDLMPVLLQLKDNAVVAARKMGVQFSAELPSDLLRVSGDHAALQKILGDVVDQALQYSSPGCEIRLLVRTDADGVLIDVTDTGVGVAKDDLPFFFNLYFKNNALPGGAARGGGVALYRVKAVIEGLGGWVSVSSEDGHGVAIRIHLPKVMAPSPSQ